MERTCEQWLELSASSLSSAQAEFKAGQYWTSFDRAREAAGHAACGLCVARGLTVSSAGSVGERLRQALPGDAEATKLAEDADLFFDRFQRSVALAGGCWSQTFAEEKESVEEAVAAGRRIREFCLRRTQG